MSFSNFLLASPSPVLRCDVRQIVTQHLNGNTHVLNHIVDKQGVFWIQLPNKLLKWDGVTASEVFSSNFKSYGERKSNIYPLNDSTIICKSEDSTFIFSNGAIVSRLSVGIPKKSITTVFNSILFYTDYLGYRSWVFEPVDNLIQDGCVIGRDTIFVFASNGFDLYYRSQRYFNFSCQDFDREHTAIKLNSVYVYVRKSNAIVKIEKSTGIFSKNIVVNGIKDYKLINTNIDTVFFAFKGGDLFKITDHIQGEAEVVKVDMGSNTIIPILDEVYWIENISNSKWVVLTQSNGLFYLSECKANLWPNDAPRLVHYDICINEDDTSILSPNVNKIISSNSVRPFTSRYGNVLMNAVRKRDGDFIYLIRDSEDNLPKMIMTKKLGSDDQELMSLEPGDYIYSILDEDDGKMWMIAGKKLLLFEGRTLKRNYGVITLPGRAVTMTRYDASSLLIGCKTGAVIFDISSGKTTTINEFGKDEIRYAFNDLSTVWVATYGNGIFYKRNGKFLRFPLDLERKCQFTHLIFSDSLGRFWCSTNDGFVITSRDAILDFLRDSEQIPNFFYYTITDNHRILELNGGFQPFYCSFKDGRLGFPSMNGVVVFSPKDVSTTFSLNPIGIERVFINDSKLSSPYSESELPTNTKSISVILNRVNGLDEDNENIHFAMLKRGQKDTIWSKLDGRKLILTSISPGKNTLLLRVVTGFRASDYFISSFVFQVKVPWYATNLFYVTLVLLLMIGVFVLSSYRSFIIKRRNDELQSKIEEATKTLEHKNEELTKIVTLKDRLVSVLSHDVLGTVGALRNIILVITKDAIGKEQSKELQKQLLVSINNFVTYIDNINTWARMQEHGNLTVVNSSFNLKSFIVESTNLFSAVASLKKISFDIHIDPATYVRCDSRILNIIVHNILSNSIKFCENSKISIKIKYIDSLVYLQIHDRGPGFSQEILKVITHSRFSEFSPEMGTNNEIGKGLGISIIIELASRMGAKMHFYNSYEGGAVVEILLQKADAVNL